MYFRRADKFAHLLERLEQVAASDRQHNIYMVHDEERLLLSLVREAGQVVRHKQQHVHFCFLQEEEECEERFYR